MPMSTAERVDAVIHAARHNRERFTWFCRLLTAEELNRPIPESHWQVRDYIAHLATIDTWVDRWFQAMARGEQRRTRPTTTAPPSTSTPGTDARVSQRRDRTLEELLEEAAANREALEATIRGLHDDTLATRFTFREQDVAFIEYLEQWTLHDPAHALDMLKALPERTARIRTYPRRDRRVQAALPPARRRCPRRAGDTLHPLTRPGPLPTIDMQPPSCV
ncbi:MAG: maleylpyruvate isomerase N-terminal domain-containing protein [Dehalococcoidia bacterium]|nr:maleylpyruvate isomerase N-terminal domain-containing protein [Dehalococcoidia bacterium]